MKKLYGYLILKHSSKQYLTKYFQAKIKYYKTKFILY